MEDISGLPDFWTKYPDADAVEVLRTLRSKKENSSQIMYWIKYMNDPASDVLRLLQPKDREEELKKWLGVEHKDLYNSKDQMYKIVKDAQEWWTSEMLDPTARLLNSHTKKVFDSAKAVESYDVDSIESMEIYSKSIETFQIIKEVYDKMLQMFKTQEAVKQKHGGGAISDADTNELFEDIE